jgi:hypothetical protein
MHYHSKGYQQGLQGWPTNVRLRTTCISCVYESLNHGFMHNNRSMWLKDVGIRLYPKKNLTHNFCQGKCSDTTCNIPDIKSMQNGNKMLEMAE